MIQGKYNGQIKYLFCVSSSDHIKFRSITSNEFSLGFIDSLTYSASYSVALFSVLFSLIHSLKILTHSFLARNWLNEKRDGKTMLG